MQGRSRQRKQMGKGGSKQGESGQQKKVGKVGAGKEKWAWERGQGAQAGEEGRGEAGRVGAGRGSRQSR